MNNSRQIDEKSVDNISMLTSFDLGALEEMDPSQNGGYRVVYDKEVPIELRLVEDEKEANEMGTLAVNFNNIPQQNPLDIRNKLF